MNGIGFQLSAFGQQAPGAERQWPKPNAVFLLVESR
jgi:hypothetical protein